MRTKLPHFGGEVEDEGDGSEAPKDAADPHRIRYGLLQAVLARYVEVQERCLVHPDLDHVDDEVRPFERGPPVEVLFDPDPGLELIRGPAGHHARGLEALGVYIVERDR